MTGRCPVQVRCGPEALGQASWGELCSAGAIESPKSPPDSEPVAQIALDLGQIWRPERRIEGLERPGEA